MNTFSSMLVALGILASFPAEAGFHIPEAGLPQQESALNSKSTASEANRDQESDSLNRNVRVITFDPFGKNLSDTTSLGFQFSFVPYVGTNGINSGNFVNDYSFNLLGGYSAGTRKLELGGLFNINRSDMTGVQLAGLFNQVGGKVDGVQLAGLFNSNLDSVEAVQLAGLLNFSTGPIDGVQVAGLANFSPRKISGVQVAGVMNFTAAEVEGSQVAGVLNFTPKDVKGSQVGLVNFAHKVDGFQLGFLNYADSMSGVPVGFLSFVRTGYHTLELGINEVTPLNLAFRTGKREFFTFPFIGIRPEIDEQLTWSFGYGVGTAPRLGKKTYLNIELSSEQLSKGGVEALNLVNRFYLGGEYQVGKKMAVYAGPTLNFRVYDTSFLGHPDLFVFSGPNFQNEKYYPEDLGSQLWFGFRAGMRFF